MKTSQPLVTVLIPHYKTLELTKICLQLLRKHTDPKKIHIIVIDNCSADASIEYLRNLPDIEFIERKTMPYKKVHLAHASALDLGLKHVRTPYVLSIHTDTLVKDDSWLAFLLKYIEGKPNVAGVGSWKLEQKSFIRRFLKAIEQNVQKFWYGLMGKKNHKIEGFGKNYYYLRSHCALYRTDLIKKFNLTFVSKDENETAGQEMHKRFVEQGYDMIFLSSERLGKYIEHVNHATMILNPKLGASQKSIKKGRKRLAKLLGREL